MTYSPGKSNNTNLDDANMHGIFAPLCQPHKEEPKMNKSIGYLIVIVSCLFSSYAIAGTTEKRYELPNHGVLLLNVPDKWVDQVRRPPADLPPTIRFTQQTGEQFEILFTPLWKMPGAQVDFGTARGIKNLVEGAAMEVASQAVEKNIIVKELSGSNIGYYFSATDKAPKPGEYKYMSQGAVGINEIMATFTILTNSPEAEVVDQAITMFGNMKHSQ